MVFEVGTIKFLLRLDKKKKEIQSVISKISFAFKSRFGMIDIDREEVPLGNYEGDR